ncbi:hypothetical protein CALCODRAFT_513341 [Calocera cornea HHB12733]|uniref:Uncharacterized protein n=1 Tax=Calocera cornea HHB12733 TaxID=1353952 RepID=A0A165C789_9BASI|nr:hypothetical protein CALCODRAFT_513341 [Calocera cornea HHB12733]
MPSSNSPVSVNTVGDATLPVYDFTESGTTGLTNGWVGTMNVSYGVASVLCTYRAMVQDKNARVSTAYKQIVKGCASWLAGPHHEDMAVEQTTKAWLSVRNKLDSGAWPKIALGVFVPDEEETIAGRHVRVGTLYRPKERGYVSLAFWTLVTLLHETSHAIVWEVGPDDDPSWQTPPRIGTTTGISRPGHPTVYTGESGEKVEKILFGGDVWGAARSVTPGSNDFEQLLDPRKDKRRVDWKSVLLCTVDYEPVPEEEDNRLEVADNKIFGADNWSWNRSHCLIPAVTPEMVFAAGPEESEVDDEHIELGGVGGGGIVEGQELVEGEMEEEDLENDESVEKEMSSMNDQLCSSKGAEAEKEEKEDGTRTRRTVCIFGAHTPSIWTSRVADPPSTDMAFMIDILERKMDFPANSSVLIDKGYILKTTLTRGRIYAQWNFQDVARRFKRRRGDECSEGDHVVYNILQERTRQEGTFRFALLRHK